MRITVLQTEMKTIHADPAKAPLNDLCVKVLTKERIPIYTGLATRLGLEKAMGN